MGRLLSDKFNTFRALGYTGNLKTMEQQYWTDPERVTSFAGVMVKLDSDKTGNFGSVADTLLTAWDSRVYGTSGMFDAGVSTSRLIVPEGWKYARVGLSIRASNMTGTEFAFKIRKNDSDYVGMPRGIGVVAFSEVREVSNSMPIPVIAGDYFEVFLYTGGDGSITLASTECSFSLIKEG